MNVLCIDTDGVGLAFAVKCVQSGHSVKWFVKPKPCNSKLSGHGFKGIERINNWASAISWADLVFCTSNDDYLERLDAFKKKGFPIFAPSQQSANLEIKRQEGMEFLESKGIDVPPYKTFRTLQEAEKYVWKNERRFVFKTMGDNEDKSLSYCAKNPADMITWLRDKQEQGLNPKGDVMLQDFIEGIEMGVSHWMGSKGWVGMPNENFEHKKLMPGNYGPNTGEMGTLAAYVEESKLFDEVLKPIEKDLLKMGHLGDVDLNCIIDKSGKPWPLEFTNRPGWPIFNIMLSEHKGDAAQWMLDAIHGEDSMSLNMEIAVGVVIAQPKFPYGDSDPKELEGIPIYGVTKKNQKYIHPQSVMIKTLPDMEGEKIVERPMWATTGDYIMVVTGMGKTIKQARERAYNTVKEVSVPNMIVRNDIGEAVKDKIEELHKFGYALSFEYGDK